MGCWFYVPSLLNISRKLMFFPHQVSTSDEVNKEGIEWQWQWQYRPVGLFTFYVPGGYLFGPAHSAPLELHLSLTRKLQLSLEI